MDHVITVPDGTRLVGRTTGRGAPVLLVHGSSGGLASWDAVAGELADELELWTFARRGYAPSGPGPHPGSLVDDAADIACLSAHVTTATGEVPHVVGGSHGATAALHAALRTPAAVRSLLLFEPPLFAAGRALAPVLDAYRELVGTHRLASAARLFAERVARAPAEVLAALTTDDAVSDVDAVARAAGCLHDLEALVADDTDLARWSGVRVPVTVVQGERTWSPVPETVDALLAVLPDGVRRVVLPGQSHVATHTAPALFAAAVREHVSRLP